MEFVDPRVPCWRRWGSALSSCLQELRQQTGQFLAFSAFQDFFWCSDDIYFSPRNGRQSCDCKLNFSSKQCEYKGKIYRSVNLYIHVSTCKESRFYAFFTQSWINYIWHDSSVGIATGYGLEAWGWLQRGEDFFSPQRPELLWGPPSLLYNGYRGILPWE
jgi:hypothetical protein